MKIRFQTMLAMSILTLAVFGLTGCPLDDPPKPEASAAASASKPA